MIILGNEVLVLGCRKSSIYSNQFIVGRKQAFLFNIFCFVLMDLYELSCIGLVFVFYVFVNFILCDLK